MPPAEEMRVKLCLVGEGGVGKTSLFTRFVKLHPVPSSTPTLPLYTGPDGDMRRATERKAPPSQRDRTGR